MIFRRKRDDELRDSLQFSDAHHKKKNYLKLEERRVLNATFAFDLVASELTLENFIDSGAGDNSVDISQLGNDYVFQLNDGVWMEGGSIAGLDFNLSNADSTLTIVDGANTLSLIQLNDTTADTFDLIFDQFSFSGQLDVNFGIGSFGTISTDSPLSQVSIANFGFSADTIDFSTGTHDFGFINGITENDVIIHDQNALELQFLSSNSGDIAIEAVGSILIDDGDSPVSTIAAHNISIVTTGSDSDIIVNSSILSNGGDVTLSAADALEIQSSADVFGNGLGGVTLLSNQLGGDDQGQLVMFGDAFVDADLGEIHVSSASGSGGGDISVTSLVTNNASDDAIRIVSAGRILDGSLTENANLFATNGGIQLVSDGAVGGFDFADLNTIADRLALDIGGTINLTDLGPGLTIDSLGTLGTSTLHLGGTISANRLTIGTDVGVHASTTFFTVRSGLPDNDIVINNDAVISLISETASEVSLSSADDVIFDSGSIVTLDNSDHHVMIQADRELVADGDIGSITNTVAGPAKTISTNRLTLIAGDGIGDSNNIDVLAGEPLRVDVDSIIAENSTSNGIRISECNDIEVLRISNPSRNIELHAHGNIVDGDTAVDDVDIEGGAVIVTSETGSIGSGDIDVFKTIVDPIEINSSVSLEAHALNGLVAIKALNGFSVPSTFNAFSLAFSSIGDLDALELTASATLNVTNLALIADSDNDGSGTLTISDTINIAGDLRIEGHEIVVLDAANTPAIATLTAARLLISTDTSSQFNTNVQQIDIEFDSAVDVEAQVEDQHLVISNLDALNLIDLNCDLHSLLSSNDDVKIVAGSDIHFSEKVDIGMQRCFLLRLKTLLNQHTEH